MTSPLEKNLRWQSRRGSLELDIILGNFWRRHGGKLSGEELHSLAAILKLPDERLRELLMKKTAAGKTVADGDILDKLNQGD